MAENFATRRGDDPYTFGIGDLFSKVMSKGFPANVRAYLETAVRHNLDLPNARFGNEVFTEKQLERLREIIKNRTSDLIRWWEYPETGKHRQAFRTYKGPFDKTLGIGSLLADVFNDEAVLVTSLGGFQVREDDKNYYIFDRFDFTGIPMSLLEAVEDSRSATREGGPQAYEILRSLATNMSYQSSDPDDKPPPVFELTIPKEGPIPRGPVPPRKSISRAEERPPTEDMVAARKKAAGGFVDKPLYKEARVGGLI